MMKDKQVIFEDKIKMDGINPYVNVSDSIIEKLEVTGKIKVLIRAKNIDKNKPINNKIPKIDLDRNRLLAIARITKDNWFRTTLVSRKNAPTRLFLDRWIRDSANAELGDIVEITLKIDYNPREIETPKLLQTRLNENPIALKKWLALPPSKQNEIKTALHFIKTPKVFEKRVIEQVERLGR